MSSEAPFQVSEKAGDAIFVVRGDSYADFVNNIASASDPDTAQLIAAFTANIKSLAPALAAVKRSFPNATVQAAGAAFGKDECEHGAREFRKGATWAAWFCPAKNCKPVDDKTGEKWK